MFLIQIIPHLQAHAPSHLHILLKRNENEMLRKRHKQSDTQMEPINEAAGAENRGGLKILLPLICVRLTNTAFHSFICPTFFPLCPSGLTHRILPLPSISLILPFTSLSLSPSSPSICFSLFFCFPPSLPSSSVHLRHCSHFAIVLFVPPIPYHRLSLYLSLSLHQLIRVIMVFVCLPKVTLILRALR